MTINIQRKGDRVLISYHKDEVIVTLALTMLEARNLRDFLTDMVLHEGDPTVIEALIIREGGNIEADTAPLPANFELIALEDSQRRNAKMDEAIRKFYPLEPKKRRKG
jgi:hypothetical protein